MDDLLTIWVIYKNPSDHPGKWVLRGQDVGSGTVRARPDCIVADDYDTLMEFLPPGLTRLHRFPGDDPVIYEAWI